MIMYQHTSDDKWVRCFLTTVNNALYVNDIYVHHPSFHFDGPMMTVTGYARTDPHDKLRDENGLPYYKLATLVFRNHKPQVKK